MNLFSVVLSDAQFSLCLLMFLAGILMANLPWPRKKVNQEMESLEWEELRRENERLARTLANHHSKAAIANLEERLAERTDERDRERAARTEAEDALRRREEESPPVKSGEFCDLEEQRLRMRCDELNRQLQDKKAEHVAVLEERDQARTLLEEERKLCESIQTAHQFAEAEVLRVKGELADALAKYEREQADKDQKLHDQKSAMRRVNQERDSIQAELRNERAAREGIQHLLDQRCQDNERLTAELTDTVAEGEAQVSHLTQQLHDCEISIARLERDCDELQSRVANESSGRQSAELAYKKLLGENQRTMREIEKLDELLGQRLHLAKRLDERETRLRNLENENKSLRAELNKLVENAATYDKETILDQILRIHRPTVEDEPLADQLSRRSA